MCVCGSGGGGKSRSQDKGKEVVAVVWFKHDCELGWNGKHEGGEKLQIQIHFEGRACNLDGLNIECGC